MADNMRRLCLLFIFLCVLSHSAQSEFLNTNSDAFFDDEQETTIPAGAFKTCDVEEKNRISCVPEGAHRVTQNMCQKPLFCCYNESADPSIPDCYMHGYEFYETTTVMVETTTEEVEETSTPGAGEDTQTQPIRTGRDTQTPSSTDAQTTTEDNQRGNGQEQTATGEDDSNVVQPTVAEETASTDQDDQNGLTTQDPVKEDTSQPGTEQGDGSQELYTMKVSTVLVSPFFMKKNVSDDVTGNDRYEGFIKDYLDVLGKKMKIKFELTARENSGEKVNGKWDGAIGDLINKEVDFLAAPLMVTIAREDVVDFTWPILTFEAVVVMLKRHAGQTPKIESFADLVKQAGDEEEIEDRVLFGIAEESPLAKEMKVSNMPLVKDAWKIIKDNSHLMRDTNNEGFLRARRDIGYAFLTDGLTAEYVLRAEPCDLQQIKTGFFQRQYAFAVPNQSPLRDRLNREIHSMELSGERDELFNKWWGKDMCSGSAVSVTVSLGFVLISCLYHLFIA